jgi:chromosome segregation ATPase
MGSMLLPLQPSWAANSSVVSWSCVGEVADCSSLRTKLRAAGRDRDSLLEQVQSLTATVNTMRKELQAKNISYEKQMQSLKEEKISLETIQTGLQEKAEQLERQRDSASSQISSLREEFQASNITFERQLRSIEKEKISLESIQTGLREKVEQLEGQRDSTTSQLRAVRDEWLASNTSFENQIRSLKISCQTFPDKQFSSARSDKESSSTSDLLEEIAFLKSTVASLQSSLLSKNKKTEPTERKAAAPAGPSSFL